MDAQGRPLIEHTRPTNCVWVAFERFVFGDSPAMQFVWSPYSKWTHFAKRPLWIRFVQPVGYRLSRFFLWCLSWSAMLTTGRWMHVRYVDPQTKTLVEFMSDGEKAQRWTMPVRYRGHLEDTGKRFD